jgi:hypothetical protein
LCTNGTLSGSYQYGSCAPNTSSVQYVGVVTGDMDWDFYAHRSQTNTFPAYMQSLKNDFGANMAVLNIDPLTMLPMTGTADIKTYYPNVSPDAVASVIAYLKAAHDAGLKVYILLSTNCAVSDPDAQTVEAPWHGGAAPAGSSPYWPDCKPDQTAATSWQPLFAYQTGEYFYNVISQVEAQASAAGLLDTIAMWGPQADNYTAGELPAVNALLPDLGYLARVAWPRGGAIHTFLNVNDKQPDPKAPLASFMLSALSGSQADEMYSALENMYAAQSWQYQHNQMDYFQITYTYGISDIDKAVTAASELGVPSSNVVLTDFGPNPQFDQVTPILNRLGTKMIWVWKHPEVATSTYKTFITQTLGGAGGGPASSCSFNGQTIASGSSLTAYQSSSVANGQQCVSQQRTCSYGTLSGSYQYASCSVGSAQSCTFNGQTVQDGQSLTAYQSSTVPYGQTCSSQTRICSNGTLNGSYAYSSCAVVPISADMFLIGGQSNMLGINSPWWTTLNGYGPAPAADTAYFYNPADGKIDPVTGQMQGAWPAFAVTYTQKTGHTIIFIQTAVGGSAITDAAAALQGNHGNWNPTSPGATLFQNSISLFHAGMQAAQSQGFSPEFKGILWGQGETEAFAGISTAAYAQALTSLFNAFRASLGASTPIYVFRTGAGAASNDPEFKQIRTAQDQVAAQMPGVYVVFRDASDFPTLGFQNADGLHYTQPGYNDMGQVGATYLVTSANEPPPASDQIPVPYSPPSCSYQISPAVVAPGQSSVVTWSSSPDTLNLTAALLDNNVISVAPNSVAQLSGRGDVMFTTPGTYVYSAYVANSGYYANCTGTLLVSN